MNLTFIILQSGLTQASNHASADELVKHDPYGLFMAIMSVSLVMIILAFIYLSFKIVAMALRKKPKANASKDGESVKMETKGIPSGEVSAAISYALHLYMQQLNSEDTADLTIKRIAHRYSPWSSKIHTLQRNPGQYN